MPPASQRLPAIDWLRGLVMVLMAMDHVDFVTNPRHAQGDSVLFGGDRVPPAADFLVRWCTHLCAPTFVLLAGASIALSRASARQLLQRAAVIVVLELTLVSWYWRVGEGMALAALPVFLQVLWAIGGGMAAMAGLRRLPAAAQLGLAAVLLVAAALARTATLAAPWDLPLPVVALLTGGPWGRIGSGVDHGFAVFGLYPLLPWLPAMLIGHVLGQRITAGAMTAGRFAAGGALALAVFAVVRGIDGFGNMAMHRADAGILAWLRCSKYPPSISFLAMELGIALLLLAAFWAAGPRLTAALRWTPLRLLGRVPMFFYLLHLPMIAALQFIGLIPARGAGAAWMSPLLALLLTAACLPFCWLYARHRERY